MAEEVKEDSELFRRDCNRAFVAPETLICEVEAEVSEDDWLF
jgi:hypothetical protein